MRMPARRAASALPPTAKTWRPKRVRLATYSKPITKASRISTRQRHAAIGVEDRDGDDRDRGDECDAEQQRRQALASSPLATRLRWPAKRTAA